MQKHVPGNHKSPEFPAFRKPGVSRETIRKSRGSLGFFNYVRLVAANSGLGNGNKCGSALVCMEAKQAAIVLREWQNRGWKNKVSNALRGIGDAMKAVDILGHWAIISQSEAKEAIDSSGILLTERKITSMSLDEFVEKLCWVTVHTEKIQKLLSNLILLDGHSLGKELLWESTKMGYRMEGVPERDAHWVDVEVECPIEWETTYEEIRKSNWEVRERAHKAIFEEPESLSIPLIIETLEKMGQVNEEGRGRCIRALGELATKVEGDLREHALAAIEAAKKMPYDLDLEPKPSDIIGTVVERGRL